MSDENVSVINESTGDDTNTLLTTPLPQMKHSVNQIMSKEKSLNSSKIIKNVEDVLIGHVLDFLSDISKKCMHTSEADKQNFEIDVSKLKQKLGYIQKKIVHQQKSHAKEIRNIEKNTRKEVVEKLAEMHNAAMERQRKSFTKLLEDTHKLYELKLETLETYYKVKLNEQKEKYDDLERSECITDTVECQIKELLRKITNLQGQINELINEKEKTGEQLLISERRLQDIQNVLTGPYDGRCDNSQLQVTKDISILKENNKKDSDPVGSCNCSITSIKQENSSIRIENLQSKLEVSDSKLKKASEEMNSFKAKLEREMQIREQLAKEMMMTEYMANQSRREASDRINLLMEQNVKLKQDLDNMEERHKKQFQIYEKMIQKSREEIDVHKREVAVLSQHFVFGNNASTPVRKTHEETPRSANKSLMNHTSKSTNSEKDNSVCRSRKLRSGKELPC